MTVIISILINVVLEATHGSRSIILPAFAFYIITFSFCKLTYERAVGFIPGRFGVLQTEEFSHWRLFFFFLMKLRKLLKDNAVSCLSGNRVLTVTSQNRCFGDLQMFLFGGTKTLLFMKWSVKKLVPPCGGCGNMCYTN